MDIFRIVRLRPDGTAAVTHRLSESLQLGERTIRWRRHEFFGYGPKTLDRILRFQQFLDVVPRHASADLAHLAMNARYPDQPHLIREARDLACLTASADRDQLTLGCGPGTGLATCSHGGRQEIADSADSQ
jgi:hypothetical protein